LPIHGKSSVTKKYLLTGFRDLIYSPIELPEMLFDPRESSFRISNSKREENIFETIQLNATLFNRKGKKKEMSTLLPIVATILRQVTFKTARRRPLVPTK